MAEDNAIPCPPPRLGPSGSFETISAHKRSVQVDDNGTKSGQAGGQVFIFPARTSEMDGRRVFYLFSVRQVVEVLRHADIQPVPFGPKYAEGVAEWRGRVLPVLSLENCLGIKHDEQMPHRTIVIRSATENRRENLHELYAIFKVGAAVHQLELPLDCEPAAVPDWITDASCLTGVYQMRKRLCLIVDIGKILNA